MPYMLISLNTILEYVISVTVPVVPEFVFIRHPFCEFEIFELLKVTPVTLLSDLPPTEPMLRPWPPEHVIPVTVTKGVGISV